MDSTRGTDWVFAEQEKPVGGKPPADGSSDDTLKKRRSRRRQEDPGLERPAAVKKTRGGRGGDGRQPGLAMLLAWPPLDKFPGLEEPLAYLGLIDPEGRLLQMLRNFVSGREAEALVAAQAAVDDDATLDVAPESTAAAAVAAVAAEFELPHAAYITGAASSGAAAEQRRVLSRLRQQQPAGGNCGSDAAATGAAASQVAAVAALELFGTEPPFGARQLEAGLGEGDVEAARVAEGGAAGRAEVLQRAASQWEARHQRLEEGAWRLVQIFCGRESGGGGGSTAASEVPPLLGQISELVLWAFCGLLVAPPEVVWAAA